MSFLDAFGDEQRDLFEANALSMRLPRGEYLLRRGEPGGDVFLVKDGSLDVVDSRTTPEVILAVIGPGSVVGEMAFIDDSPRSADVRASLDCHVLQWPRDDLRALLSRRPDLAATFYQTIAKMASQRVRNVTTTALASALGRQGLTAAGAQRVREEAGRQAEHVKSRLFDIESRLRQDPGDSRARRDLRELLDNLEAELESLFTNYPEPEPAAVAAKLLCRELHPYLVRSSLAERSIRRPQGMTGTAEILAHVLVDTAGGDGQLGELLDRWLLDRPTLKAMRAFRDPTVALVATALPTHRNRRVCLINAGTGSIVAALGEVLAAAPTVLTVVDQSRDALAFLDAGLAQNPRAVELQTVQENLAQFAMGRCRHAFPPQDVILMPGMLEYMPDRIAISLLQTAQGMLTPDGTVVVSALGPSTDAYLLDRLLDWPTIRRTRDALLRVIERAGLVPTAEPDVAEPGLLIAAQRRRVGPGTRSALRRGQRPAKGP